MAKEVTYGQAITEDDLRNRFNYHPPANDKVKETHEQIRLFCFDVAAYITENVPDGREQALAVTKLEEAMMWANAGLARNLSVVGEEG